MASRQRQHDRFRVDVNDLIRRSGRTPSVAVSVKEAQDMTLKIIKEKKDQLGNLHAELRKWPEYEDWCEYFKNKKPAIDAIPQQRKVRETVSKKIIDDMHFALVVYTTDLYSELKKMTMQLLQTGKTTIELKVFYLHLFYATTCLQGPNVPYPTELMKGVSTGLGDLKVGEQFTLPYMNSTTSDIRIAYKFATNQTGKPLPGSALFVIKPDGGILHALKMDVHSVFSSEQETLFSLAHSYRVTDIKRDPVTKLMTCYCTTSRSFDEGMFC